MRYLTLSTLLFALLLGACGGGDSPADSAATPEPAEVTVYSGRSESLIGPLLEKFEAATGVRAVVRYAGTAELAATLMEEGGHSPADVFISQDAAALGALSAQGLFVALPQETLDRVLPEHRSPLGDWVGLSGRARSVVFNTGLVSEQDLPRTLEEITLPEYKGRFGVAPANASFQAHMAAYGVVRGEEALAELLAGLVANEPGRYPKNSAIVEAVIAGEVEFGLVNHYYLHRALSESPDAPASNAFMQADGVSAFVNLAGGAVLSEKAEAVELLDFLLGQSAQEYFRDETHEFPLAIGVEAGEEGESGLTAGQLDFASIAARLEATLAQIQQSGLLE